ncbi:MAG: DUF6457 domain-containing protein [Nocardioidaceae bacterium]
MTLHDWIDELCDALDLEVEIDEGLILDLAREAAHSVERVAAPISTYLLGYAAALQGGSPETVEELAGKAMALAEQFGGEDVSADDFDEADDAADITDDEELVDVE